uniref:Uncharacterized protein n=1 Tax=Anguilla anguilla TaxID=7936 RepID=A0A0E9UI82_ANGAN
MLKCIGAQIVGFFRFLKIWQVLSVDLISTGRSL